MKARIKLILRRRSPRTHEEAKRFASRVSRGLVVAGAIVALVLVANRWGRREELQAVRIIGNAVLDSAEIMRTAGVHQGMALESLALDSFEGRIAAHPFIERASVYRGSGGTLVVEVTERAPVAVTMVDGAPMYLDSLGVLLPYRFSSAGFDLPVIGGIETAAREPALAAAGQRNTGDTAAGNLSHRDTAAAPRTGLIDSARTREALALLAQIRAYDDALYRQISEIRREASGEYTLRTADGGVQVWLGTPVDIGSRLKKLDRFLTTVLAARGPRSASTIDLRWKGQVVVRWRNDANYAL